MKFVAKNMEVNLIKCSRRVQYENISLFCVIKIVGKVLDRPWQLCITRPFILKVVLVWVKYCVLIPVFHHNVHNDVLQHLTGDSLRLIGLIVFAELKN